MDGGIEARTSARLDEVLRRIQERKDAEAANDGGERRSAPPLTVHAGRDVVFGACSEPANDGSMRRADREHHSLELHYALLGLVSFAVLLLIVIVVLLARRDLRPIKPSGATDLSAVTALNPCDATFFLFFLGPITLKARFNAAFSPLHPALFRRVPQRSNHLSRHTIVHDRCVHGGRDR